MVNRLKNHLSHLSTLLAFFSITVIFEILVMAILGSMGLPFLWETFFEAFLLSIFSTSLVYLWKVKKKIWKGKEQFETIFKGAAIGIALVDREGRPIESNPAFQKMLGYSGEELSRMVFTEFTHPEDVSNDLAFFTELVDGKRDHYQIEKRYIRKDGQVIWANLLVSLFPSTNDESPYVIGMVEDITERKLHIEKLRLYEKVIEKTLQGIIITDKEGAILFVNQAFTAITGYSMEEALGKNLRTLYSKTQDDIFCKNLWATIYETGQWQGEIWSKRKNGDLYAEWLNMSSLQNDKGEVTNYIAVFSDITQLKLNQQKLEEANEELHRLSYMDGLTNVMNRRFFDESLDREWKRAIENKTPVSLILLDIDFFKNYNDTYGHQSGDDCLKQVATALKGTLKRSVDWVARFGGEEFAVVLPNTDVEGASRVAEALRSSVEALRIPHVQSKVSEYVTISVGVATLIPDWVSKPEELISAADQMLYQAKQDGRNRVKIYKLT